MEPWVVDVENYIKVVYPVTGTLEAFYTLTEGEYLKVPGVFTNRGDGMYFIAHTFTLPGNYTIKLVDTDNLENVAFSSVDVVDSKALTTSEFNTGMVGLTSNIDLLVESATGNWKIVGTQMIFYKTNGTELSRYNLLDESGKLSAEEVFERQRV